MAMQGLKLSQDRTGMIGEMGRQVTNDEHHDYDIHFSLIKQNSNEFKQVIASFDLLH